MKKIITFYLLLTFSVSNSQCPTPSNLSLSIPFPTAAQLSWTENGSATIWEIAVIPDFNINSTIPESFDLITTENPATIVSLPPAYGCYAFFIRSHCSISETSQWIAVGSLGCSTDVYAYLNNLTNLSFTIENVKVFPNPSTDVFNIDLTNVEQKFNEVIIYNILGEKVFISNLTPRELNSINLSHLEKGYYLAKLSNTDESITVKIIKN